MMDILLNLPSRLFHVVGISLSLVSLLLGIFILLKPTQAIEIQIKFYKKINWNMKPVSMEKEIRNTKSFGVLLSIFAILAITYVLIIRGI